MIFPLTLVTVTYLLWQMFRCIEVFCALDEAERTSDYRLAMHCGRNPHDVSIMSCAARSQLLAAGRR